jgi:transcriptional regulator with XRE-family HTH domain
MQATKKPSAKDLADLLVRFRTERNLTLQDVAASTQLTAMTLSMLERRKGHPRRTTLLKLEEFLRKHGYFAKSEVAA